MKANRKMNKVTKIAAVLTGCLSIVFLTQRTEAAQLGATHIGTFDGYTTFVATSSNGIHPELWIEVVDDQGNFTQYESENGIITIPDTKEGAYVTQAKLLGKTKYRDQDTNELLDEWEEGRNLTLESVENPTLIVKGKNLLNDEIVVDAHPNHNYLWTKDYNTKPAVALKPNTEYFLSLSEFTGDGKIILWSDGKQTRIANILTELKGGSFTTTEVENGFSFYASVTTNGDAKSHVAQLEEGRRKTNYEPFKENILTTNEQVTLRGFGGLYDSLDLINGVITYQIEEVFLDGSQSTIVPTDYGFGSNYPSNQIYSAFRVSNPSLQGVNEVNKKEVLMCDIIQSIKWLDQQATPQEGISNYHGGSFTFSVLKTKLDEDNVSGFKAYLKKNPATIQYHLRTPIKKDVLLFSTYQFPLLNKSFVQVSGSVPPIITSITIPTEELVFSLNPNQEVGQQFIAPEFEVTNESNAPLTLTLKTFEQTTDVFNDVLPSEHDSWDGLTKEESKDIALGLVAKLSDEWLAVVEEPHYVSETNNNLLGTIKPKGTVGFEFIAHHGQAFDEILNPSYRLTFVFDLLR